MPRSRDFKLVNQASDSSQTWRKYQQFAWCPVSNGSFMKPPTKWFLPKTKYKPFHVSKALQSRDEPSVQANNVMALGRWVIFLITMADHATAFCTPFWTLQGCSLGVVLHVPYIPQPWIQTNIATTSRYYVWIEARLSLCQDGPYK